MSWISKLQTVMASSTIEAEYMAATQACKEAIWIKRLMEELGHKQEKIPLFCDSQSALHITRIPTFSFQDKARRNSSSSGRRKCGYEKKKDSHRGEPSRCNDQANQY